MKHIPYGRQSISEDDITAVKEILSSDWLTQGPKVESFEKSVASYCGSKFSVAVCNATAALHLACRALGVKKGDYVWTAPNTFLASANCALYCGANIDFVDIDPQTYNMSVKALAEKLQIAEKNQCLPKLVIPVHFAGQSCAMREIWELSKRYNFAIVEDASHAIGGNYCKEKIGCCQYSDMVVFSFHPVKIITTGEGGMITTNKKELYDRVKLLVTHGMTRNPEFMDGESDGAWYYQQVDLGYNYRLTDIQCALGLSQLGRIDEFVSRRHELAKRYDAMLRGLPVIIPFQANENYSAYHLYVIQLKLDEISKTRKTVFDELRNCNIGVAVHYIPVHTQPYYRKLGFNHGDFPIAENYYRAALTLPLFPALTFSEQDYIIESLTEILK